MKTLFSVAGFTISIASATPVWNQFAPRAEGIQWGPCSGNPDGNLTCGFFEVPMDYHDESKGNACLAVAKYQAQVSPKLGTLFTNPGGPGISGVEILEEPGSAPILSFITGGQYDIVSWDPRGVGQTIPGPITCFESQAEFDEFWNNTLVDMPFQVRGNFSDQTDLDFFYSQVDPFESQLDGLGKKCMESETGQFLQYVGTAATVRDLISLSDYLEGPDCGVHYWGFSYGTTIGQWLINMFPERVGRIVLDGVQEPMTYASEPSHLSWGPEVAAADSTYQGFALGCAVSGSFGCAIAGDNATAENIIQWTWDLIDQAYNSSTTTGDKNDNSTFIRSSIYNALFTPTTWADYANGTFLPIVRTSAEVSGVSLSLARRSLPSPTRRRRRGAELDIDSPLDYTAQAITCGDSIDQPEVTTKAVFDEFVRVCQDVSQLFGAQFPQQQHFCHRWPVRAVERYSGPFNNTLANQILIIGNQFDPATPFANAKKVADLLGDSAVLIQQAGFGHTSIAQVSSCSEALIAAYFTNGTLPDGNNTTCPIDPDAAVLFPVLGVSASSNSASTSFSDPTILSQCYSACSGSGNLAF